MGLCNKTQTRRSAANAAPMDSHKHRRGFAEDRHLWHSAGSLAGQGQPDQHLRPQIDALNTANSAALDNWILVERAKCVRTATTDIEAIFKTRSLGLEA